MLLALALIVACAGSALAAPAPAANPAAPSAVPIKPPPPTEPEKVRELYVPFDDLNVLLEGAPQRVLLDRKQFEELLAKAKKTAEAHPPTAAAIVSADYQAKLGDERAQIKGDLVLDVLEDGLQTVGLDLGGVGLFRATLDDKDAPIGLADDGRLVLFVEGKGRHSLTIEMVAPLQATAARQVLNFQVPSPASAHLGLTVPGDVEVKSGAPVVSRVFDAAAAVTRIELLPQRGNVTLVMSLNSRLKRKDRVVVARGVFVNEVTQAYERLHASVSMAILHRAVDDFRFVIPAGFEVTDVKTPQLARWAIRQDGQRRILEIFLREETTDTVVLNISAIRTGAPADPWTLSKLEPIDVVGQVAVVGLLVEDRMKAESITPEGLVPIDTSVLARALPPTVLQAEPGAAVVRPVVAYYAPQEKYGLTARFVKPPARLLVTTNLLLMLKEGGLEARGGFAMIPEEEKLFSFDFSVPGGWDVTDIATDKGEALAFERYGALAEPSRVRVRLPRGIAAGQEARVYFHAVCVPAGWFADWTNTTSPLPVFAVAGARRDTGAIAIEAQDDMTVRPATLTGLIPLDENEKAKYGLEGYASNLAYRYEGQPYGASLAITRTAPRITARTYSFFRIERDALAAHYEILYDVAQARARRLAFLLPKDTPTGVTIRGLDNVVVKENASDLVTVKPAEGPDAGKDVEMRRWTVLLAESRSGTIRLAIDFTDKLPKAEPKGYLLPVVRAAGVVYQSGLVSVEGSAELDVEVAEHPRRVDIGELVDAEYQPGRRLLGAYGFLGDASAVKVDVSRQSDYALPPAIVQRAEMATVLAAEGLGQTAARFLLRTKDLFLEVKLPEGSTLWTVTLDGKPTKPQREEGSLLLSLPSGPEGAVRDLQIVYETPLGTMGFWGKVDVPAPRLYLHATRGSAGRLVPTADLAWSLYLPTGYQVMKAEGSVVGAEVAEPTLGVSNVLGALALSSGGVDFDHGALGLAMSLTVGRHGLLRHEFLPAAGIRSAPAGAIAQAEKSEMLEEEKSLQNESKDFGGVGGGGAMNGETVTREHRAAHGMPADKSEPRKDADEPSVRGTEGHALKLTPEFKPAERPETTMARIQAPARPSATTRSGTVTLKPPAEPSPMTLEKLNINTGGTIALVTPDAKPAPAVTTAPSTPAMPPPAPPVKTPSAAWALAGVSSLKIDLDTEGEAWEFQSLGTEPRLGLTIANLGRLDALAMALALGVFLAGLALTNHSMRRKLAYLLAVGLVATLIPVITGQIEYALVVNAAFYAACLLVPYYLAVGLVRLCAKLWRRVFGEPVTAPPAPPTSSAAATTAVLLVAALFLAASAVAAEPGPAAGDGKVVVEVVESGPPPKIPDDALVLPYDPDSPTGVRDAAKVLVPYSRYVELWNLANPDKKIEAAKPPAPYALAGARYTTTLAGDDFIVLEGSVDIDVYGDQYVEVPLPLGGAVLAKADLDGKPARLRVVQPEMKPVAGQAPAAPQAERQQVAAERPAAPPSFVIVYAAGKGRHHLDLAIRIHLDRRGGWRVAEGRIPAAAATSVTLRVPAAQTEVRLGGVRDRAAWETKAPNEEIRTALAVDGALSVQWRPKVSEGQVDQSLTATSVGVLDVQEDRLHLAWSVALEFRRSERDFLTVEVPEGYLVEKVEGTNVRGWEIREGGTGGLPTSGPQKLEVTLLKPAKDQESFKVFLWRPVSIQGPKAFEFEVPALGAAGAMLHSGQITIRRSPLLDLQTVSTTGVTRADLPADAAAAAAADESPLGIKPYQSFRFAAVPFTIKLAAAPVAPKVTAAVQTILKMAERESSIETRVILSVQDRPLYRIRMAVPADLRLDHVSVPGDFEWAVMQEGGRRILTIYMAAGRTGQVQALVRGVLGEEGKVQQGPKPAAPEANQQKPAEPGKVAATAAIPTIEVLDVERQEGDIAVLIDPAFDVRPEDLKNLTRAFATTVAGWLGPKQRDRAKLVLHYTLPDYGGRLALVARPPDVACYTVTNVRITDRSLEEAILLEFKIREAGIREVSFLLPWWMKDARVSVPLLRQKTVERVGTGERDPWRVRLELQDEVMDQLRVLVENDRLLTGQVQQAPIPVVETGRTDQRYVALENAGRDEVVVEKHVDMELLSRQQNEWKIVAALLHGGTTQAYIVGPDAKAPLLEFKTKERAAVETAGMRIGLVQTLLVLDVEGAYRAQQVYHVDNQTEQYLEVELPEGAELWTAHLVVRNVSEPVKPALVPGKGGERLVRIPIVKTAAGDLDYLVVLKYAGKLPKLQSLRQVEFPLIHAKDRKLVELSQVQLYLPETQAWFDFGGTMTRVTQEGELEAEYVSYQNKVAEKLVQTLRSSENPYAQARAMTNLGEYKVQLRDVQQQAAGYRGNEKLRDALSLNSSILTDADKQVETFNKQAPQEQAFDNNDNLRKSFAGQKLTRAKGVVKDIGRNWDESTLNGAPTTSTATATGKDGQFNDKWFEANRLENLTAQTETEGQKRLNLQPQSQLTKNAKQRTQADQPAAPEVAQGKAKMDLKQQTDEYVNKAKPNQAAQGQAANEMAFRYQQKLEQRQQQEQQQQAANQEQVAEGAQPGYFYGNARNPAGGRGGQFGNLQGGGQLGNLFGANAPAAERGRNPRQAVGGNSGLIVAADGAVSGNQFGLVPTEGGEAGVPAGMASLDVVIPQRGQVFKFTMPRGDIQITARPVSQPLVDSLLRIAGVLAAVGVLVALRRFLKRRQFGPSARRAAAATLIVLGFIGLLLGIFPLAGLAMFVIGIVWAIRLALARRREAKASLAA